MDPLRPVDPDEEFSREAATEPDANDSDVETQVDIQSASAQKPPPVADQSEVADDPMRIESDLVPLPPVNDFSSTIAEPTPSEPSPMALPDDAASEPPATLADSTPAEADVEPAAEPMPAVEPVDAAWPSDTSQLASSSTDLSADQTVPGDFWPAAVTDPSADAAATVSFPSEIAEDTQVAAASPMDSIADHIRSVVDPIAPRAGSLDHRAPRDGMPATDAKADHSDSQVEPVPDGRKLDAALRAQIEAFLENFRDEGSRTRSLLSPAADGGPPMARPIVLVSLAEEQMQAVTNEALAQSGSHTAKRAAELAQEKVDEAFWLRDCEMRALFRGR